MKPTKFLAIDLGAESGRASVGTLEDSKLFLEEVHRFPNVPVLVSGHLHWDVFRLFDEVKNSLKRTVEKGHGDIESVGIDAWGVDFGLVKANGELLDLPFTYRDSRTNGIMEKVFKKIPREEIYSRTGIQLMQINTLYQLVSMMEQQPDCFKGFEKLLFIPDMMNYFLTGKMFSEYTIASTSQMLNASTMNWDEAIFNKLSIRGEMMASIISPATVVGKLRSEIAVESGLKDVDVVAVGSHDTASAIAAVPLEGTGWAYLSSGTWSLLGTETDMPIVNDQSFQKDFTNEGGVGSRTNFLKNIMGLWLLQEVRRDWENNGESFSYDELIKMAHEAKEFKCVIDPSDGLFLNPENMSEAILDYCRKTRQRLPETKGEVVRSIFESLAIKYKSVLDDISLITGNEVSGLHIVGGGSRNEMLNQFAADATGIPVLAGPVEATVIGNIMVQAMAKGKIDSINHAREIVRRSFYLKKYIPQGTRCWGEVRNSTSFAL